jgi:predicted nucleic acid-binding protein
MRFLLDSNVLFTTRFVSKLYHIARPNQHSLCVSALAHAERIAQLRRQKGSAFNAEMVDAFIRTHEIEILAFDRNHSEAVAVTMADWHPTNAAWQDAKWRRCAEAMGQRDTHRPATRACPATVDWFIAAHGLSARSVLVSEDSGSEFAAIRRIGRDEALEMAARAGDST